jgi:RNA polymerase sigma-70 factor (ECF subfamily)
MPHTTLQSGDLTLAPHTDATTVTPFDDIAAVHELYGPRIFRFLLLSTRNRDLAHSLTQDTFLTAWRTRASFRGDCSLSTWLNHLAINLLRSHTRTETFKFWRRASANAVDVDDLTHQLHDHASSAESALLASEKLAGVWQTVGLLSPAQRSVFLLRFVEELELPAIAQSMGMPLPTVKTHLYRALDRIRAEHNPHSNKKKVRS